MLEYIKIGKLNRNILKDLNVKLITDEVIFTIERLEHVESRRMSVYDEVKYILPNAIYKLDYIYKDWNNRKNTLIFIKNIDESSKICKNKSPNLLYESIDKYE